MWYVEKIVYRCLTEKYKEACRDICMVFINLENIYDSVPRGVMW